MFTLPPPLHITCVSALQCLRNGCYPISELDLTKWRILARVEAVVKSAKAKEKKGGGRGGDGEVKTREACFDVAGTAESGQQRRGGQAGCERGEQGCGWMEEQSRRGGGFCAWRSSLAIDPIHNLRRCTV